MGNILWVESCLYGRWLRLAHLLEMASLLLIWIPTSTIPHMCHSCHFMGLFLRSAQLFLHKLKANIHWSYLWFHETSRKRSSGKDNALKLLKRNTCFPKITFFQRYNFSKDKTFPKKKLSKYKDLKLLKIIKRGWKMFCAPNTTCRLLGFRRSAHWREFLKKVHTGENF